MIDLHCHILPGVDDGAADFDTAIEMAIMAVADGITTTACTPHIMPGVYDNSPSTIRTLVDNLKAALAEANIPLNLVAGSDAHMRPDFASAIDHGKILSLNDSRYVLFEPPHHVAPPRLEDCLFGIQMAGYVPILTHPERLSWIESRYPLLTHLAKSGIWMQVTAGSISGRFGKRPKYWAERMLSEGLVHILATDAHNCASRPPLLAEAHELAVELVGKDEAAHLVMTRPAGVLRNTDPSLLPAPLVIPGLRQHTPVWKQIINAMRA
jgi:protein-tyrosine phosphatase